MQNFKAAYDNIRYGEREKVRKTIMRLCKWKHKTQFTMAKNGDRPPTKEQSAHIKEVFAAVGIDALTGLEIKKK